MFWLNWFKWVRLFWFSKHFEALWLNLGVNLHICIYMQNANQALWIGLIIKFKYGKKFKMGLWSYTSCSRLSLLISTASLDKPKWSVDRANFVRRIDRRHRAQIKGIKKWLNFETKWKSILGSADNALIKVRIINRLTNIVLFIVVAKFLHLSTKNSLQCKL